MNALLLITVIATGQVHVQGFSDPAACWQHARQHAASTTHRFECVPVTEELNHLVTANYYDTARIIGLITNITRKITDE